MKNLIRKHIIEIILVVVASVLSVVIFPFLLRYKIKFDHKTSYGKNWISVYCDLNNDGKSEQLIFISDSLGFCSMQIIEGKIVHGHWKFDGKFAKGTFYACGDFDKNGYKEVYIFITRHDSLFLNAVESFSAKTIIEDKAVRKLHLINGIFDINIHPAVFADLNSDNRDEIVFMISTGYNYKDRVTYGYYIREDSLIRTPVTASCLSYPCEIVRRDTNVYISGTVREPGNTNTTYPCSDSLAWIIVYDKNLQYLFPPGRIGKYPSIVYLKPFIKKEDVFFAGLYVYGGLFDTSRIFLVNDRGDILHRKALPFLKGETAFLPSGTKDVFTIIDPEGNIYIYDADLSPVKTIPSGNDYHDIDYYSLLREDITGDDIADNIYSTNNRKSFLFFDPATLTFVPVRVDARGQPAFVTVFRNKGKKYLSFNLPGETLFYSFSENILFKIRYLIPIGLLLLLFLVIWGIKKIFNIYFKRRMAKQAEITRLQLLNVKNQLDSHFTFNILDCIGNSFRKNDFETADTLFVRYARMLQQSVHLSGDLAIPLDKEMAFIENYLTIEKIRSGDRFDFMIDNRFQPELMVPKFILFTFVENAVKHGVLPLTGKRGEISVKVIPEGKRVKISVRDNGVGMQTKNDKTQGMGSGLKIVDQMIVFFKKEYKQNIEYDIQSRENEGTTVNVLF